MEQLLETIGEYLRIILYTVLGLLGAFVASTAVTLVGIILAVTIAAIAWCFVFWAFIMRAITGEWPS